jgi:23S rRNA (uracil1939-C5)-methyltransferase
VHDERARAGQLRYAVVRANRAGDVLVGIVTTSDAPRDALAAAAPSIGARGVVWLPNDATSGAILGREAHLLCGDATIPEQIDGVAVDVGIDTFLQVNLDAAEALYRRLVERAGVHPGMSALDVYCGIGPIALLLARAGADVLGVERNAASVDAARAAAAQNGIPARFEETPAAELPALLAARPVDVVVVNPPRQGLEESVRGALAAGPPATLVYVSCGPDSLGRDLAALGLRVESVEPFDLMPGTGHVETLVIAKRR